MRQSPNFAVVLPFSATVTIFCDSVDRALDGHIAFFQLSDVVEITTFELAIVSSSSSRFALENNTNIVLLAKRLGAKLSKRA